MERGRKTQSSVCLSSILMSDSERDKQAAKTIYFFPDNTRNCLEIHGEGKHSN